MFGWNGFSREYEFRSHDDGGGGGDDQMVDRDCAGAWLLPPTIIILAVVDHGYTSPAGFPGTLRSLVRSQLLQCEQRLNCLALQARGSGRPAQRSSIFPIGLPLARPRQEHVPRPSRARNGQRIDSTFVSSLSPPLSSS